MQRATRPPMARSPSALALILAAAPLLSGCSKSRPWAKSFGGDGELTNTFVAVDSSGAVALAGGFQASVDLGGGKLVGNNNDDDVFIGMLGPDGSPLWSAATGDVAEQSAMGVAFDPDGNLIVIGGFFNRVAFGKTQLHGNDLDGGWDTFLVKLDRSGKTLWAEQFGDGDDAAYVLPAGVAVGASGDITIAGSFDGSVSFGGPPLVGPGLETSFVARIDRDRKHVFSLALGGENNRILGLTVDSGGDVYVAGLNQERVEIGGAELSSPTPAGSGFVARLGPDGTPRWAFQLGGRSTADHLTLDGEGNLYITGSYTGTLHAAGLTISHASSTNASFVLQVSGDGTPRWLHAFNGGTITGIAVDEQGRPVVGGVYVGLADFGGGPLPERHAGGGAFLTTLDPGDGKHRSTLDLSTPDQLSAVMGLAISGKDAIVTGTFTGTLALPDQALEAEHVSQNVSSFVARIGL